MRREPARLQADYIGDFHPRQGFSAAGQVAGAEDLKIVRGGMARHAQIALALAENLVQDRGRQAIRPKAADGQIVAVTHQPCHGVGHRRHLVDQGSRLASKKRPRPVRAGIGKKLAVALGEDVHGKGAW